jgi:hypothetical protein
VLWATAELTWMVCDNKIRKKAKTWNKSWDSYFKELTKQRKAFIKALSKGKAYTGQLYGYSPISFGLPNFTPSTWFQMIGYDPSTDTYTPVFAKNCSRLSGLGGMDDMDGLFDSPVIKYGAIAVVGYLAFKYLRKRR